MSLEPGTRLGPYVVGLPLGQGGMGLVYRAHDSRLGREVAIKALPHHLSDDERALARFEREARAVASLSHPNILAIYDFGREGSTAYAVMELLDGRTLRERLADGPLPVRKALECAIQLAHGLAAAHDKGIVHRDLKPENVFLTRDGRVKILDFGLAQCRLNRPGVQTSESPTEVPGTDPGTLMGTVGYMAPEQARGEAADARSDLFALGCILFEMLTGRPAFRGRTVAETYGQLLKDDSPPLAVSGRTFPPGLELIVNRCLEKDPAERFRSAHDLGVALTASLGPSQGTTTYVLPGKQTRLTRAAWLALAAAVGVACTLGVLAFLGAFPARSQERQPEYRWFTFSGRDRSPAVSRQGVVAFASDREGTSRIWLKQAGSSQDALREGEVPLTSGPDDFPRFSPDGTEVLFSRLNEAALYRVTTLGTGLERVVDDALFGDWSPDGESIAFIRAVRKDGRAVQSAVAVATKDGEFMRELARVDYGLQHPRWSPDGMMVAAVSAPQGSALRGAPTLLQGEAMRIVLAKADGSESWPIEAPLPRRGISSVIWSSDSREIIYSLADSVVGASGSSATFVRQNVRSGVVLDRDWSPERASVIDLLGEDDVVFDTRSPRQNLVEIPIGAGERAPVRWITRGNSADRQPVYTRNGKRVVFSSNRRGSLDLWVVSAGGELSSLTSSAASEWDPAFMSDGRLIYSSDRSGHFEIWMANADGHATVKVTDDGRDAQNPTATPDGNWIVYASGNPDKRGLWKIRPDGTGATRLVEGDARTPVVSPTGEYVLYRQPPQSNAVRVNVVRLSDGAPTPFEIVVAATRPTEVGLGRARWMPDGRRIAFIGQDAGGATGVYVQAFVPGTNTTATRRPLGGFDPENATESFDISPDGTRLVISGWVQVFSLMEGRFSLHGLFFPRR